MAEETKATEVKANITKEVLSKDGLLVAMTAERAIATLKKNYPDLTEEVNYLEQVCKKDIVMLGVDLVFALRDKDGEIRAFKQALTLSEKGGTLIQPVQGGPYVISAQGYEVWQEAAGACVIFPSEVLVNEKWQQNPAVIRDPKTNRILMIYARAVAFRFSSKGIPMVSDWTTIYDTPSYRMIDLLGKAKQFPQAFKLLPVEMNPDKDAKGTWAKYPFDEATNLWMNTSHDEALKWLAQIINREKKAIDFAQTFAKRNSLKHLSGLQRAPSPQWTIPVICWRPMSGNIIKWDATQYAQLQTKVGKMISGDRKEFGQIELQAGAERVSDDVDATVLEQTTDPEDQVIDIPGDVKTDPLPETPKTKEAERSSSARVKKLSEEDHQEALKRGKAKVHPAIANLEVAIVQFPKEYKQALVNLGMTTESEIRVPEAQKIIAEIGTIMDKANS